MFDCCTELAAGNKSLEFDCQTELPGGGGECETQEECYENYSKGLEVVKESKANIQDEEDDDDSGEVIRVIVVVAVILVLAIAFAIIAKRTSCFGKPLCPKKGAKPDDKA